jgi:tRNA-binding protein
MITWEDFEKFDLRCGTIISVMDNDKARKPAYIVEVEFGDEVGIKTSSAQITDLYSKDDLLGKQILGVVNFEAKYIAGVKSEVLICGFYGENNAVSVVEVTKGKVANGAKLG